jgi:Papain family cysteine protease
VSRAKPSFSIGQIFKKTGKLLKLSEQQLVDCARGSDYMRNQGCGGGVVSDVFEYIKSNGVTLSTTYPYPYRANDTFPCSYNSSTSVSKLNSYYWPQNIDENYLKNLLVQIGPLSVRKFLIFSFYFYQTMKFDFSKISIDASKPTFLHYKSGVYKDDSCSTTVNQ